MSERDPAFFPVGATLRHHAGSIWRVEQRLAGDWGAGYEIRCLEGASADDTRQVWHDYLHSESGWQRVCACGCWTPVGHLRLNAIYANRACNTRAWRDREGIVGYKAVKRSQRPKSSGVQLPFLRTALNTHLRLIERGFPVTLPEVEEWLAESASDSQRAQLHAREQRRAA